jgi:tetratricopeptide (TPR) repeat protein
MVDPDRRPTAQEIEELIDLVRRDPASPAFIDLGEAYLALGRPRDAIQVGTLGLEASPENLEGRVMLARAFASLHQWKEAQGELLRVVKVDRSNRQGFALLGEVLLRRSDFERAVPVLQHAQNLDPTSPQILSMLRRARAGQQLDPPNPIPTPVAPRGETDSPVEIQRSPRSQAMNVPPKPRTAAMAAPVAPPQMPTMAQPSYTGLDSLTNPDPHPPSMMPPPMAQMAAQPPPMVSRAPKQTAPPPMSVEGIKPRIIASTKVQNAAAASLRQSAAVGENYLNDLLTGGLLDVAGVRVPDEEYDLRPDRRWGRSTRRAFIFLFVVLVLGIGGGGTWYWWSEKQKSEAVARLQTESKSSLGNGEYTGIVESLSKLQQALEKDKGNKLTFAYYVEAGGLGALLYGEARIPSREDPTKEVLVGPEQVDAAYKSITSGEDALVAGEPGTREMVIGKAALELARLPNDRGKAEIVVAATQKLAEVNKMLDDHLAANATDRWAKWLKGRAMLAAGQRRGAAAMLKAAAEGPGEEGLVVAQIDYANLLIDDGKTADGLKWFKTALDRTKGNHQLAILGEAIAKSEASIDVNETIGDLNAKFVVDKASSRVAAYRWLALAIANLAIEEYPTAIEALGKATLNKPPAEPRFWSRVAWVHYKLGRPARPENKQKSDLEEADNAFGRCIYFSPKPEADPTMQLVDSGLSLARGLPDKVLDLAAKIEGVRPRLLRTYALLDLGKSKEAYDEAGEILKTATGSSGKACEEGNDQANIEAKILCEQARMLSNDKERTAAADALLGLARQAKSKLGRHALGVAYLSLNDLVNAKEHLGQAVKDISDTSPNPFEYRTRTALAEIALLEKDLVTADKIVKEALNINTGYYPTRALLARILVRNKQGDEAMGLLQPILAEASANTPMVQLTLAEALIVKKDSTAKDKESAEKILTELKGKPGIPAEEIGRVAAMIDPDLPKKLDVPVPAEEAKPGEAPKPPKPPRRGRR